MSGIVIPKVRVIRLYRNILREHKRKLPYEMKEIGDSFVKNEFRLHKSAKPAFVQLSFRSKLRSNYYTQL